MRSRWVEVCRRELHLRPVLPEGKVVSLGDVVELADDGGVRLIGTSVDLIGVPVGATVRGGVRGSKTVLTGDDVSYTVLGRGQASSLFPQFGKADIRVEVQLSRSDSVFALVDKPMIKSIRSPFKFFAPMLSAYGTGLWRDRYALVTDVASPVSYQVVRARTANTKVLLSARADVGAALPTDPISLAGKLGFAASSREVDQYSTSREPVLFNAISVNNTGLLGLGRTDVGDSKNFLVSEAVNAIELAR
jgi:hypothetical protein